VKGSMATAAEKYGSGVGIVKWIAGGEREESR
jgi:hypothetical protein